MHDGTRPHELMLDGPARVISLNVGGVRHVEWRGQDVTTGIWKHPVQGRVALRGAYLRIVREGDIGANDAIEITQRPAHGVTLRMMAQAIRDPLTAAALRRVARLPPFWRDVAEGANAD